MKIMFRPHRGGFKESMAEAKSYRSMKEVMRTLDPDGHIEYYNYDPRIQAETFLCTYEKGGIEGYIWFVEEPRVV